MILIDHSACIGCVGCAAVCPYNAITYEGGRMRVFEERCKDCGICVRVCPANAIEMFKGVKRVEQLSEEVRRKYGI